MGTRAWSRRAAAPRGAVAMVEDGTGAAGASGEAGAEADAPQSVPVGPEYHRMSLADFVSTRSGAAASATAHSDPAAAHTVLCHPLLRERWGAAEHVYEEEAQMVRQASAAGTVPSAAA